MKKLLIFLTLGLLILTSCQQQFETIVWKNKCTTIDTGCIIKQDTVYRYAQNLDTKNLELIEKFKIEEIFLEKSAMFPTNPTKAIANKEDIIVDYFDIDKTTIRWEEINPLELPVVQSHGYLMYNKADDNYIKLRKQKNTNLSLIPIYLAIALLIYLIVNIIKGDREKCLFKIGVSLPLFIAIVIASLIIQLSFWAGILALVVIFSGGCLILGAIMGIVDGIKELITYSKTHWGMFVIYSAILGIPSGMLTLYTDKISESFAAAVPGIIMGIIFFSLRIKMKFSIIRASIIAVVYTSVTILSIIYFY